MSEKFSAESWRGEDIQNMIEVVLFGLKERYKINYKNPPYDIARRFLNEIVEFEGEEEKC